MELDVKSRCWIATFAWSGADAPTEADIPMELNFTKAQLKQSLPNSSCSIWLEFNAQQRASRIVKAFANRDAVVVKRTNRYEFDAWCSVPADYQVEMVRPVGTQQFNRGEASEQPGPSGHDVMPIGATSESDSDAELTTLLKRRRALKRRYRDYQSVVNELAQVNAKLVQKLSNGVSQV